MFALVDVNNFYASCETIFRPDLCGKPVVVVSNNDGCVISRSAEAKALGIAMAAPWFKIKSQLNRQQVEVFSSNYTLYADMSHRVMAILEEMTPRLERYSIDEAFMDLSGMGGDEALSAMGHDIRKKMLQYTGLNVGVGIAPTKTLAKLANHAAKRWPQTRGVVVLAQTKILQTARWRKLLALTAVDDVWGVGHRISKKLNLMGINSALDLAECSNWVIRKNFNVVLERTARELRGEPCLDIEAFPPTKQHILCSRSFGQRITDYADMRQAICTYAERAAEKLRLERQYCRFISVFIRTSPHGNSTETFYHNQASGQLMIPSSDTRDIVRIAVSALDRIWLTGHRYMKAGVMLGDFYSQNVAQLNLFDEQQPHANSAALMAVMDRLNRSHGAKVWFGGQGIEKNWTMKRERLSPAWTTRYQDLPKVT